jgi:hypothetical protein
MIKKPRLTRAQIRETLQQVPMEAILLGHSTSKEKRLTPSQIKFAEEIAKGNGGDASSYKTILLKYFGTFKVSLGKIYYKGKRLEQKQLELENEEHS